MLERKKTGKILKKLLATILDIINKSPLKFTSKAYDCRVTTINERKELQKKSDTLNKVELDIKVQQ